MSALLRSRLLICLALLAWLAQMLLPTVHAATMAGSHSGLAAWCGTFSPGLARQLAALPQEIREILVQGSVASDADACERACAAATSGSAPPPRADVVFAAPLERIPLQASPAVAAAAPHPLPPARGPPQHS